MSVDFRQRKPSEYLKILRRRKWFIILPTIAIATAVTWVVMKLPDVYQSTTLIVVKPSTLPTSMVSSNAEDNLTRQLAGITQVVTSRSSLEPLVQKYELYKAERLRGDPKTTQAVTAELASKYISAQTSDTQQSTQSARTFMDNQVNQARAALSEV